MNESSGEKLRISQSEKLGEKVQEEKRSEHKLPPKEEIISRPQRVNLESFYQEELARLRIEQATPGKRAWEVLGRKAEGNSTGSRQQEEAWISRPLSMTDKVRRQALFMQARVEGVRNLEGFQQLVDYFESTVYESEGKHLKVPKGLTDEQKKTMLEEWSSKGWRGERYDFHEGEGKKHAELRLSRNVPVRLGREHATLIKCLASSNNNPVELAEGLRKMGFWFSEYKLKSPEEMGKLAQFFNAPNAKEALELAQGISKWDNDWFAGEGYYGKRPAEVDQIGFLIQLAQNADPKSVFSPETIKKIDTISNALNMRVGVREIDELQAIMNNPDYLDFVALLAQQGKSIYRYNIPIYENIIALDKAGVLKPLINLYHSGVSVETPDRYYSSDGTPSLRKLFDSYEAESKPQEVQREVIAHLQGQLNQEEVQKFLQKPQRQKFVGLLGDLREFPLQVSQLGELDSLFGENLSRGKEAIYILKFMQADKGDGDRYYGPSLQDLSKITASSYLMNTFTNPEFPKFLQILQTKTGYIPGSYGSYDLYYDGRSKLADVFNNPEARQGLTQDSTAQIIKALHPNGGLNLYQPEYYIRLASNPNMFQTISVLRGLGYDFKYFGDMPSAETLEAIANSPDSIGKLASPELKELSTRLTKEFKWEIKSYEIMNLIQLHDDNELRNALFAPENVEFIKKIRPNRISLSDLRPMLALDTSNRELLVKLVEQFSYYPDFNSWRSKQQQEMLIKLLKDTDLRVRLFSEHTLEVFKRLQKDFGYYKLEPEDVETIVSAPGDFPDFISELKTKYQYSFQRKDLIPLLQLSTNREGFYKVLDGLVDQGYQFKTEDIAHISHLTPYADKLSATLASLNEVMGYKFNVRDSQKLVFLLEGNSPKDRLISLKQVYDRYKDQYSGEFGIDWVQNTMFIEGNEDTIRQLEQYNYKFNLNHINNLRWLLESPEKESIFQALNLLRDNLPFSYNPNLPQYYVKLAQIPGVADKIRAAASSMSPEDLLQERNFKLFVVLGAESGLYNHAQKLLSDDYFRSIRDAQNRLNQFMSSIYQSEIPDSAIARIFVVSQKATELDRLALKLGINSEIAKAANREDWYGSLLKASNFQEANEGLTRLMTELALPVVYADLQGQKFVEKQNGLVELANRDKEFGNILEMCCRSVGVYGKKYPSKGMEFTTLMGAIRQSLDLNLERNPKVYSQKRAEFSVHQFDRIFNGFPQEVRNRVMKSWLDLSSKRRLRVSGEVITAEEATLNRLNRIRDVVRTDLSVHLQELFTTKIKELEAAVQRGETNGPGAEQLAIYRQYLLTPEGAVRQDIPGIYRSVETFIRSGQKALRNPETPKEEKAKLGKSLGTYQAISDSLKALYRLSAISEERYKARRNYLSEVDKNIGEFSGALKRLRILDPDRISSDVNMRALEEEVLLDLGKLRGTMAEENVSGQTIFETESTVSFRDLSRAPEMTQSCQRLTEVTGYNHAAYSRLIDGSNEMIDVYELRNGEKNRLARSFIELSRINITGEEQPKLAILIDREYVNPQYQNFSYQFSTEMVAHMLDRVNGVPEVSLLFDSYRIAPTQEIEKLLKYRGYQIRQVSGEYFINESNVKLAKYYDSMGGVVNVAQPSSRQFGNFYIIEKSK